MRVESEALRAACRAGLGGEPPRVSRDVAGARALLEWLVARIARRRMSADDVRAGYCARSAREVLAQGCVPFTAPCADLSGVAALLLAEQGFSVTLVLGGIKRALRPVKFQCGIELDLPTEPGGETRTWVVGFGVGRSVLYEGRFLPTPRRPWVFRRRPEALDLDRAFLSYFEPAGREGLAGLVPGYDLERDIESHVRRSGRLSFGLARLRAGGEAKTALRAEPEWAA